MRIYGLPKWAKTAGVPPDLNLGATCEMIAVTSMMPAMIPDPSWVYVDPAGHAHAFLDDGQRAKLPTLVPNVETWFDGDGEEHSETTYTCTWCSAPVEPRWIPDPSDRTAFGMVEQIPGPMTYTFTADGETYDLTAEQWHRVRAAWLAEDGPEVVAVLRDAGWPRVQRFGIG